MLRAEGELVIGLIDRESPLGQDYAAHQAENVFYREATFFSAGEVESLLGQAGFRDQVWVQSISAPLLKLREMAPARAVTGRGAFLVVRACHP